MATKYEWNDVGTSDVYISATAWKGQTFTIGTVGINEYVDITSIKLLLLGDGSVGTVTVSIRAVDGSGLPTGPDLSSGTTDGDTLPTSNPPELREISMSAYTLSPSTKYAIIVRPTTTWLLWKYTSSDEYAGGNNVFSNDSGNSWTAQNYEQVFEVWGETGAPPANINPKVKVAGTFATKTAKTKISGNFVEKPVMVKVGGTFQ